MNESLQLERGDKLHEILAVHVGRTLEMNAEIVRIQQLKVDSDSSNIDSSVKNK